MPGKRGTTSHPPSFHVADVAQTDICRRFAWQAWDRCYWVAPLGRATSSTHTLSPHTLSPHRLSTHTLSTNTSSTHTLSPHTLSPYTLAQLDIHRRFTWQAWHKLTSAVVLRGRRGTDATGWRPWAGLGRL